MALNVTIQTYRGTQANLAALASTGKAGVLAWTTDSHLLFMDSGTGIGIGTAWIPIGSDIAYFTAASSAAMIALAAKVGDIADRTDLHQNFILTAFPATTAANWVALSPDASVTGIQGLVSGTANQWVSYIDASGVQHLTQPSFANISGTVAASQLPNPTATTLGGVESIAAVAHEWVNAISTSGVPSLTQPAFADISSLLAQTQLPATIGAGSSLTDIDCGTF